MDELPQPILSREVQLVQPHGMPKVLHPAKVRCLRLDEGNFPLTFVPISDWKCGRSLPSRMGSKVRSFSAPRNVPGAVVTYLTCWAVDKEAVIAVVRVVLVDETREELDVGIIWCGSAHGRKRRRDCGQHENETTVGTLDASGGCVA